jgi:TM2 domain-containing membrane protein YozV
MNYYPHKSKFVAYFLCIFLGIFGAHRFYLKKKDTGTLYFLTLGIFGIGWIFDLFTLWQQVEKYNLLQTERHNLLRSITGCRNQQNIIVNVNYPPTATQ